MLLSLGPLLFPLTALVFPASRLSFWPYITFTDRLWRGGLGEEKEFNGNPLKTRTALQSGAGRAGAATGSQSACEPWFPLCTFNCKSVGQLCVNFSFEWSLMCASDCNSWMEFWQNN